MAQLEKLLKKLYNPPNVVYPPNKIRGPHVFLAGTIDNGASRDWQSEWIAEIQSDTKTYQHYPFTIVNPRRPDWNTDWTKDNDELVRQIRWELNGLNTSTDIFMWLEPNSKSPISLLEMGLFASSGNLLVGCPEMFYRYENVRQTVEWNNRRSHIKIGLANTWESFVKACKLRINESYGYE